MILKERFYTTCNGCRYLGINECYYHDREIFNPEMAGCEKRKGWLMLGKRDLLTSKKDVEEPSQQFYMTHIFKM